MYIGTLFLSNHSKSLKFKHFFLIAHFLHVRSLGETFLDVLAERWASGYDHVAIVPFTGIGEFTSSWLTWLLFKTSAFLLRLAKDIHSLPCRPCHRHIVQMMSQLGLIRVTDKIWVSCSLFMDVICLFLLYSLHYPSKPW